MSRGINKVILVGNLGANPETRYLPSGMAVANFSVATTEVTKDKQTGETQNRTEWHRVVFFARLAEIAGEYLRKGSKVYLEGRLQTRKWQDKNGVEKWTTEIIGNSLLMLDDAGSHNATDTESHMPANHQAQKAAEEHLEATSAFDDDIPF